MKIKNEIQLFFQDIKDLVISLYKYLQKNLSFAYFIVAVIHFIATFYTDSLIFVYAGTDIKKFILIKRIFLIIIILVWQFIGILIKNYSKSTTIRDLIKFAGIYFFIMLTAHVLLWPFIVGDQMYYSHLASSVFFHDMSRFQGVCIPYLRIYSLMLIPNLGGIIVIQISIISLIFGYVMVMFKSYFKLSKLIYIFYIPFLMPLVIQYNLYMEKDILYSYFFMLLFAKLIFIRLKSQSAFMNVNIISIALIASVAMSLRSEGILLFVATPAMLYLLNYKVLKVRNMILFLLLSILFSFIFIPHYVSAVILDKDGRAYKNVYILNDTLKELLNKTVEEDNEYILDEFKSADNLEIAEILSSDIENVGFYRKLTKSDRKYFKKIRRQLIRTYFDDFVRFKFNMFYYELSPYIVTTNVHNLKDFMNFSIEKYNTIKDKIINLNPQLYSDTIQLLKKYNSNIAKPFKNYLSVWYIFLYFLVLVGAILFRLKRILILVCFLVIFLIIQILIVPYNNFRFFFQGYITAYLVGLYIFFYLIKKMQNKFKSRFYIFK